MGTEQNELINGKLSTKRLLAEEGTLGKLQIRFDIQTLNMIIAFLTKKSVLRTRKTLQNIRKLFNNLDPTMYVGNVDMEVRIWAIQNLVDVLIDGGFEDIEFAKTYCKDHATEEYQKEFIDTIGDYTIQYAESKYLIRKIDSTLEYGYVVSIRDVLLQLLEQIDVGDYLSYESVSNDLYAICNRLINLKRRSRSLDADQTFSLNDEVFEAVVSFAVDRLKDRNRIFRTGIRYLNTILSPGFLSKRLYTFLAFPGKGKSTMLLKSAIDIKKYNGGIKTKNPDKQPAILFLTLENDIPETIERAYNMTVSSEDIRNFRSTQVIKSMREVGGLKLTKDNTINIIIKEYKNRELSTDDLYGIINDLGDDGTEVIALILDYMKRIRPAEAARDEKTELKNITNELKELAKFFDIPVITAQQLNRNGAAVVDAALQANKEDVTRLVGRDAVAGAWEIIENSDWVCIVNPQMKKGTDELFMTFKLLKRRYRSIDPSEKMRRLDYFNQPFEPDSEIRLVDDVDLDEAVALLSLSTEFEGVEPPNQNRGSENVMERKSIKKKKGKDGNEGENPFPDFDVNEYDYA